jgi:hypothetical protein
MLLPYRQCTVFERRLRAPRDSGAVFRDLLILLYSVIDQYGVGLIRGMFEGNRVNHLIAHPAAYAVDQQVQ